MRYVIAFALLVGFAALNLGLNFYAPNALKLVLVPVFSLVLVAALAGALRRGPDKGSPPS